MLYIVYQYINKTIPACRHLNPSPSSHLHSIGTTCYGGIVQRALTHGLSCALNCPRTARESLVQHPIPKWNLPATMVTFLLVISISLLLSILLCNGNYIIIHNTRDSDVYHMKQQLAMYSNTLTSLYHFPGSLSALRLILVQETSSVLGSAFRSKQVRRASILPDALAATGNHPFYHCDVISIDFPVSTGAYIYIHNYGYNYVSMCMHISLWLCCMCL